MAENTPEPTVRAFTVHICDDCLHLRGEMCHEPNCRFCRRTMAEVAEYLDVLAIRPVIDGVGVLVDDGTPLGSSTKDSGAHVFGLCVDDDDYILREQGGIVWTGNSIDDAATEWRRLVAAGATRVRLTSENNCVTASHRDMQKMFGEPAGTMKCPLCGDDAPHTHNAEEVADHQAFQHRRHIEIAAMEARLRAMEPKPSPGPKQATCETNGHIFSREGVCVFCAWAPTSGFAPTPATDREAVIADRMQGTVLTVCPSEPSPATVCVWKPEVEGSRLLKPSCVPADDSLSFLPVTLRAFKCCPYCTLPLTLSSPAREKVIRDRLVSNYGGTATIHSLDDIKYLVTTLQAERQQHASEVEGFSAHVKDLRARIGELEAEIIRLNGESEQRA